MSYTQYSLPTLTAHIARENPRLTPQEATNRALVIRRELHRLWKNWLRSQIRYHKNTVSVGLRVRRRPPKKDDESEISADETLEEIQDEPPQKYFLKYFENWGPNSPQSVPKKVRGEFDDDRPQKYFGNILKTGAQTAHKVSLRK